MRRVLVTGATGFIGQHVTRELVASGYKVIATSVSEEKAKIFDWYPRVTYIPFDLRDFSTKADYFEFFQQPDLIIHLAWEGLPFYKEAFHISENLPRHYAFLRNLVQNGLKDITVTGTCFEYGLQEGGLSEGITPKPENAYAQAKNSLRLQLEALQPGLDFHLKWVRLFYMYGAGQHPNSLLSQVDLAIQKKEALFRMSPGDQLRDYLPVETVARYVVRIALQNAVEGIINCGSGIPISVKDLVLNYLRLKNTEMTLVLGYYPYSELEPRNFWANTTKLKTILENERSDS